MEDGPGSRGLIDRKPRQAYSAKQLERLEAEFKVGWNRRLMNLLLTICIDELCVDFSICALITRKNYKYFPSGY